MNLGKVLITANIWIILSKLLKLRDYNRFTVIANRVVGLERSFSENKTLFEIAITDEKTTETLEVLLNLGIEHNTSIGRNSRTPIFQLIDLLAAGKKFSKHLFMLLHNEIDLKTKFGGVCLSICMSETVL